MSFPVQTVNPGVVSFPGRRVLYVMGVACVLGFTTSFAHFPAFSNQQEMIPSGYRSRALLSTSDVNAVRVSPIHLFY